MWELISELRSLLLSPFFYFLTLLGNGFIFICGFLFYHLERDVNPGVHKYLDAIWWSYTTATTTGYGNITPVTDAGKILSIILMITGLALFATFTALFAETILAMRTKLDKK
jgi:voltage-gated potassium channel